MLHRRSGGRRRRSGAGQDTIPAIRLLVYADVMGKPAEEVELGFDPAEDLVGWGEDFQVAESDLQDEMSMCCECRGGWEGDAEEKAGDVWKKDLQR